MAACLWAGESAAVFGRTAALLWGLEGVREDSTIHIASPGHREHPDVVVRKRNLCPKRDVTRLGRIPITTVTRTLIDFAGMADEIELEAALDYALRTGKTSLRRLTNRMEDLAPNGRRGMALLRRVLDERIPGQAPPESDLERLFLNSVVKPFSLPRPEHQHWVRIDGGGSYRLDFAYPDLLIGIEVDSYAYHMDRPSFQHDRTKASLLATRGWLMLFFTWKDVSEGSADTATIVRDAIDVRSRGATH